MIDCHPTYDPGDGGILPGVDPTTLLFEGPTPWFIPSNEPEGDYPPFCGTPPGPIGDPGGIPPFCGTPPGPSDPLDCW
ncbi:hypothetical protein [Microvirga sp. CF3016]|uniref:hypothetical protein n=1 Tax=Microvirga sp. CF3016 TaxID=3110181 RepID=UPI002E769A19|nr:hypothetical protein [Microvirga sp. CF3016]MEE1611103.1 hypothetical protein [Microvirga sp. CF3016]